VTHVDCPIIRTKVFGRATCRAFMFSVKVGISPIALSWLKITNVTHVDCPIVIKDSRCDLRGSPSDMVLIRRSTLIIMSVPVSPLLSRYTRTVTNIWKFATGQSEQWQHSSLLLGFAIFLPGTDITLLVSASHLETKCYPQKQPDTAFPALTLLVFVSALSMVNFWIFAFLRFFSLYSSLRNPRQTVGHPLQSVNFRYPILSFLTIMLHLYNPVSPFEKKKNLFHFSPLPGLRHFCR
jgi:hypothetical protein